MSGNAPKVAGKISVECPHCGSKQLESALAKSTFCRTCSGHFDLDRPRQAEAAEAKSGSIFKKFETLLSRPDSKQIVCFECHTAQIVSTSAKSSMCSHCGTYIDLTDFKISTSFSRSIQTQGAIVVTAKGEVTSTKVACGSAIIEGKVRGNLTCSGTTRIRLKGKILGGIETQHLIIEKNSDVEFARPVRVRTAEINGKASGRVIAESVVTINKSGSLDGAVYAKSITIERGGVFRGDLVIGEKQVVPSELVPAADPPPFFKPPKGGTFAFG